LVEFHFAYYKSMLQVFRSMSTLYGHCAVLEDTSVQLSPLFRYYAAITYGCPDIAEAYRARARAEFDATPAAQIVFEGTFDA
jgi:hypothetical protein